MSLESLNLAASLIAGVYGDTYRSATITWNDQDPLVDEYKLFASGGYVSGGTETPITGFEPTVLATSSGVVLDKIPMGETTIFRVVAISNGEEFEDTYLLSVPWLSPEWTNPNNGEESTLRIIKKEVSSANESVQVSVWWDPLLYVKEYRIESNGGTISSNSIGAKITDLNFDYEYTVSVTAVGHNGVEAQQTLKFRTPIFSYQELAETEARFRSRSIQSQIIIPTGKLIPNVVKFFPINFTETSSKIIELRGEVDVGTYGIRRVELGLGSSAKFIHYIPILIRIDQSLIVKIQDGGPGATTSIEGNRILMDLESDKYLVYFRVVDNSSLGFNKSYSNSQTFVYRRI